MDEPESGFVREGGELRLSNLGQLELLRGMAERGVPLRTPVRGFSMSPFIRDADVLTIAPMNGSTPHVGEVVAFILPDTGRLAIHRIIRHLGHGWLMRGDNCPEPDGVIRDENIIGRVIRVERRGQPVRLGLGMEGAWIAALNRGGGLARLKQLWTLPRRTASFILRRAQALSIYRTVGRRLAPDIAIVEADECDMEMVHRYLNPYELYQSQPPNPDVTNWVARGGVKILGFVQLVYHPEAHFPWVGHWLFSLTVWGQYRGLGIGEKLTRRVIKQARDQGAQDLLFAVFEDNKRAIGLYEKLGFEHVTVPALEPLFKEERQKSGRRRIVMGKRLQARPQRASG